MKNTWVSLVIVALVFGAGGFYGGMQYGKNTSATAGAVGQGQGQNQGGSGQGQGRLGRGGAGGNRGDVAFGDIIGKDATSITVKLQDGGSKIVFVSSSTDISKFNKGTLNDLAVGTSVMARGTPNADGSLTAQSIQIRPAGAGLPGQNPRGQ